MAKVWSSCILGAALGKTAGTYDAVGTITLKKQAKHLYGFKVLIANSTPTNGESAVPLLRIDSKDLGITSENVVLAYGETDGIATNNKEAPVEAEFIAWKVADAKKKLANADIDVTLSVNSSFTGGFDIAISAVYGDSPLTTQLLTELLAGSCGRMTGGAHAEMDAGIKANTLTAFTTGIKISSAGKEIIGLGGFVTPNAPTAGEACIGYTEFSASQLEDFSPQQWPNNFGWTASLGTPVGTPVPANSGRGAYHPTRFGLEDVNFEMDVGQRMATALTNEGDGIAMCKWR